MNIAHIHSYIYKCRVESCKLNLTRSSSNFYAHSISGPEFKRKKGNGYHLSLVLENLSIVAGILFISRRINTRVYERNNYNEFYTKRVYICRYKMKWIKKLFIYSLSLSLSMCSTAALGCQFLEANPTTFNRKRFTLASLYLSL